MTKKRDWMTAGELLARLDQDPEYQQRMAEQEQARLAHVAGMRTALDPILDDLRDVGIVVEEWNEVVSHYAPLSEPVVTALLRWLPRVQDAQVQEAIVRALAAAPTVRFDGRALAQLFESTESEALRWAIGNTLSCTNPAGVEEWVQYAVQNRAFGKSREMLAIALARLVPADIANPMLLSLLGELPIHAAMGLALSGTPNELGALEAARDQTKGSTKKYIAKSICAIQRRDRRRRDVD